MSALIFTAIDDAAILPTRATANSAGYDLHALHETAVSHDLGVVMVQTGIAVKIPDGYYGRIAIRSGHAYKQHMIVTAGVIDRDFYPGRLGVLVSVAKPGHSYVIAAGERFAQLIIEKIYDGPVSSAPVDGAESTHTGYGSTGL